MRSLSFLLLFLISYSGHAQAPRITFPPVAIQGANQEIVFEFNEMPDTTLPVAINGEHYELEVHDGKSILNYQFPGDDLHILVNGQALNAHVNTMPAWLGILPPLLAILLALLFREVLSALFIGVLGGALLLGIYSNGFAGILPAFLSVIDKYILTALNDPDHLSVILFSMLIGGMVAVISKNGGMSGVVDKIAPYAKSPRSGQFVTWLLGIAIFFDDYANTLVVGNTMRPVTDRLRISREKLSYIVDSTAAPVASIAFVTTWIGTELSYIKDGVASISELNESAYSVFLNSLAYSFYPIFTLGFMLFLILKGKDFGSMLRAEQRARTLGLVSAIDTEEKQEQIEDEMEALNPETGVQKRWINAVLPVAIVVFGTLAGLYYTGSRNVDLPPNTPFFKYLSAVVGASNSYQSLLWSSLSALVVALLLTVSQRLMKLGEAMESVMKGFKTMLPAVLILVMAWSLAEVTKDVHTADYITSLLVSIQFNPVVLPSVTFILAALIAFSTGSSWSTMAILYPLILPAGWMLCRADGMTHPETLEIFYNLVSCVLAGSVLGDHCSPISDTTILSSLASSCNHLDHVRTQLPYALTVGFVSILAGTLPGAMGLSSWITMPLGLIVLFLIVQFAGKVVDNPQN